MTNTIKNAFKYKIIGIALYFFFSLGGLSILLIFPPKDLLFKENSEEDKIKLYLFKDFAKSIHENINTSLIKNLTLTEDGESCPENFEQLKITNQYYGNFSKFYGNKSICIERLNDIKYSYRNLLKSSEYNYDINNNKKKCGTLVKNSSFFLNVSDDAMCPLNNIEINSKIRSKNYGEYYYKISKGDQYLTPIYGYDPKNPVIINIEIINNYKICLEKYSSIKDLPCEFPDNNECFIEDHYEEIFTLENEEDYKLNPINLAKWNLENNNNINHLFCKDNLKFHIFVKSYINFTSENLKIFDIEFPSDDYTNNPLYKTYEAYKSTRNIDKLFHLISYNLLIWSLIHFILQIMLYFEKKGVRNLYICNGMILFFIKLFVFFAMITNYYSFYLKIEKVYLTMDDEPRNKVLQYYSLSRNYLIAKVIVISIIGFLIICIDLIIFFFSLTIQWGVNFKFDEKEAKIIPKKNELNKVVEMPKGNNQIQKEGSHITNEPYLEQINPPQFYEPFEDKKSEEEKKTNNSTTLSQINLEFICKDNISKSYKIKIGKNEFFKKAVNLLKEQYSELKRKEMKVFTYESNIINKDKTIIDNGLSDNVKIFIIS